MPRPLACQTRGGTAAARAGSQPPSDREANKCNVPIGIPAISGGMGEFPICLWERFEVFPICLWETGDSCARGVSTGRPDGCCNTALGCEVMSALSVRVRGCAWMLRTPPIGGGVRAQPHPLRCARCAEVAHAQRFCWSAGIFVLFRGGLRMRCRAQPPLVCVGAWHLGQIGQASINEGSAPGLDRARLQGLQTGCVDSEGVADLPDVEPLVRRLEDVQKALLGWGQAGGLAVFDVAFQGLDPVMHR